MRRGVEKKGCSLNFLKLPLILCLYCEHVYVVIIEIAALHSNLMSETNHEFLVLYNVASFK